MFACWQGKNAFPAVAEDDVYLTRRDQIGLKKRKKDEAEEKKGGGGKNGAKKGKIMRRPAAAVARDVGHEDDAEEEDKEEDQEMEEGESSGLRRATPLDTSVEEPEEERGTGNEAKSSPKAQAASKAKAKAKTKGKPGRPPKCVSPANTVPAESSNREHAGEDADVPLRMEIHECLKCCQDAGELDETKKHTHNVASLAHDNAQLSTYWPRGAVGVKVRSSADEAWKQVAYFSRPTRCVGTNIIIAKKWVGV